MADIDVKRQRILDTDRQHIWRPYTSFEDHQTQDPLVIESAEGVWLYDVDGQRYFDANSSWWVATLGHNHPRLRRALAQQAETLMHCAMATITHAPAALLAQELSAVAPPGLTRVFFSDDGSTAVEVAIKMAFQYWQQNARPKRKRFITLAGAYHGDTTGCMSVAGASTFKSAFGELCFDVICSPDPEEAKGWDRVMEQVLSLIHTHADELAGVIIEPLLQGSAGMRMWSHELLLALREATQHVDTFLIADEVFTGYGRTGTMWACDQAHITPDILCTAKAFSGGILPMAATLTTDRIYDGFRGGKSRALMHGHSFYGNPLGAAIAREVLAIYREENILANVTAMAQSIQKGFERIASLPGVKRVRCMGTVGAADIGNDGYLGNLGWKVFEAARKRGLYLRPLGDTVYICPPMITAPHELDFLLEGVYESIREVML